MKLLIAADIFPPESGGPATYSVTLANELMKRGDDVTIVSLNPKSDRRVLDSKIKFYHVHSAFKLFRYGEYFLLLWLHVWRNDIVYAMGPVNAGWIALWANRLRFKKKKFVVKVVGDYAWEQGVQLFGVKDLIDDFQKKDDYDPKVISLRKKQREVVKKADKVITPSLYLKDMVSHQWGAGLDRVQVIYNAMEFVDVAPTSKPAGEKWIVSVGRLVPWKGMQALIEVISNITELAAVMVPAIKIKLKIVGDGPEMEKLKTQVVSSKLQDSVELLGNLSHEKTLAYIHASDVFILNSAYEGMSHVILEALSFKKPVLASRVGGNPEIVKYGITGFCFEYNNKGQIEEQIMGQLEGGYQGYNAEQSLSKYLKDDFFAKFKLENMIEQTKKALEQL